MNLASLRHWAFRLPDLTEVARRFPLPVAATIVLASYYLFEFHTSVRWQDDTLALRVPAGLMAACVWALGAALFSEAHGLDARTTYALTAAGCLVIALIWVLGDAIYLNPVVLVAAASLGLACAAYVVRGTRNGAFWQFNHDFWFGWLAALIGLALFAGGVAIIFESLRYLFGVQIPPWLYEKIYIIAGLLVAPLYGLRQTPGDLTRTVAEGEPKEIVSRLIAALSKFILVPLLLIYSSILHTYALKILADGTLPKGRLGWMVLSFGAVLAATALVTYPTRQSGGRVVQLFWRYWPWLLVVPLCLLFVAVGSRVKQYGVTESRYLVVLAGVWLASIVATQGLAGAPRRDLRLIPGVLAALLALASLGPWGAAGWSIRSQVRELSARLDAAGLLKNGRVPADARPTTTLLPSDRQQMHGVIDYLSRQGRLDMVRPLFKGEARDPFEGVTPGTARRHDTTLADKVRERLGLGRNQPGGGRSQVSYHSSGPVAAPVDKPSHVVGPINLYLAQSTPQKSQSVTLPDGPLIVTMTVAPNALVVLGAGGRTATFDLARLSLDDGPFSTLAPPQARNRAPLAIAKTSGDLGASMLVLNTSGLKTESGVVEVRSLSFWLLIER